MCRCVFEKQSERNATSGKESFSREGDCKEAIIETRLRCLSAAKNVTVR